MFFPAWNKLVVSESAAAVLKTEEEVGHFLWCLLCLMMMMIFLVLHISEPACLLVRLLAAAV